MHADRDLDIIEQEVSPTLPSAVGGSVDAQITTARKFPRSLVTFVRRATEMATLNADVAASCVYALPRDGKTIEGPSARLAEIVAHAWGNLRIQAGVIDADDRYVTARGEAWDVESNVAIAFEVRRRITGKSGKTYTDDMITVTGNAASSIALRNAVFKAVPSSFWKPIYQKCRSVIAGDQKTFGTRRDELLKAFMVAGVTPERVCHSIGLKGISDITLDHMATLAGILNAIRDGDTTIEEAFPDGAHHDLPTASVRKDATPAAGAAAPQPAAADPKVTQSNPARHAPSVGAITDVREVAQNVWRVYLDTGFMADTRDRALATAAMSAKGHRVDLTTTPARKAGAAPAIDEMTEVTA